MVKVKLKKLNPNASVPTRATEFAGGWDVTATDMVVEDGFVICKLGFSLEIPKGYKVTIVPRSSITKTSWIMQNSPGLGDSDYRGEYQVRFRAIPTWSPTEGEFLQEAPIFPYSVGERIAQIYIEEVIETEFEIVDELEDTNRGDGGFGSTGK